MIVSIPLTMTVSKFNPLKGTFEGTLREKIFARWAYRDLKLDSTLRKD